MIFNHFNHLLLNLVMKEGREKDEKIRKLKSGAREFILSLSPSPCMLLHPPFNHAYEDS